jgi:hypothetical protein
VSQRVFLIQLLGHVTSLKVVRDPNEPKEVSITFTFSPNQYLADDALVITKKFSNVHSPDPDVEVTSSKAPIKWKSGKDLTQTGPGIPPSFFTWFGYEEGEGDINAFGEGAEIALDFVTEIYPHAHILFNDSVVGEDSDVDSDEDLDDSGNNPIIHN